MARRLPTSTAGLVANLGSTVSQVQTENTAQNASVTQLQTQRDALSSVNLNDEASATDIAWNAAIRQPRKVFAILNSIMASALNLGSQTSSLVNLNKAAFEQAAVEEI